MRPAIVYCGTRREVEEVSEQLRSEGLLAVGYHAGMPPDERAAAQHRFMEGDAEIVVATNAFGMGVDKADVRAVDPLGDPEERRGLLPGGRPRRARRPARPRDPALQPRRPGAADQLHQARRASRPMTCLRSCVACRLPAGVDRSLIDAPSDDRDRVCLGIAERAGLCSLEPARGGRLSVTLLRVGGGAARVASICRQARDRAWRAYRAVEAFSSVSGNVPAPNRCSTTSPTRIRPARWALLRRLRSRHDRTSPTRAP